MTHTSTTYCLERVKSPPSTFAARLCTIVATPPMMPAAASGPLCPFAGPPRDTRTPKGLAPSAARSDNADPAARKPISLKSSQSVRKWTFSSDLSMLIARVVEPTGITAQSSPSSDPSPVILAIRSMMPRMRSNSLPGPRFMGRSFLQHLWSLKFHKNWRSGGRHILPGPPHIRKGRQDIGRAQAAGRPLPGALLGGPTEGMRAECRRLGGRRSPGEECADEPGEQITAAARGEAGIAARDDVLGAAQIGDDGWHTLQQNGAIEFCRRARRSRPTIVRRFVGECVSGEGAKLSEMRSKH